MPLAKHRPDFAELIAIAALQRKNIQKRQKRHYSDIRKKSAHVKYAAADEELLVVDEKDIDAEKDKDNDTDKDTEKEKAKDRVSPDKPPTSASKALPSPTQNIIIDMSDKIRWFLDLRIIRLIRLAIIALAFLNLTYEAQTTKGAYPNQDDAAAISDIIVAVYFLLEGALKVLAFYAHMDMHKTFDLKMDNLVYFQKLGFVDIILGIFSLYFGSSSVGGWFRLLRVLMFSSFALDETPHLVILVSGITNGLKSILSTCLLLFLVFMVYAAFGLFFFEKNDPYHFGTIALAMWSFFELSTLDNWSQVLYVNMYGCDKYPAYYTVVNSSYTGVLSISRYGSTLMLPICKTPEKQPAIAAIMFLSFIVLCAFILVNLTIAAVTSGINVRLDRIKNEGSDVMALSELLGGNMSTIHGNADLNKLLISDPDMLLMMLKQVWKEQDAYARKKRKENSAINLKNKKKKRKSIDASSLDLHTYSKGSSISTTSIASSISSVASCTNPSLRSISTKSNSSISDVDLDDQTEHHNANINYFEWRGQSILCRDILSHYTYHIVIFGMISFSALLVLVVLQSGSTHISILVASLMLQILFTLDLYVQMVAAYPNVRIFFHNKWQCFDAVIVLATWVPVFAWGRGSGVLDLLNIFRIVRMLKLLRWIHELNVILHSVASSAVAIFYVYVLIFGLAYHFAVAGVFLFSENDPQHFGDLGSAFVTLFQIQSLDDWSEIARTNMYGCDYWGYDTGEEYYDEQCVTPEALGWFAALYFVLYIMMSVMVLLSLFVGIIITSMELLKEGIKEENEVWEKVKVQQKRYNMRDATINNLLEIFDLIDVGKNGKLTLLELKPIFDIITITEASQFSLFMMVDTDNSGQIDFSEFLELLYLVGKAYKAQRKKNKRPRNMDELKDDEKADAQSSAKHSKEPGAVMSSLKPSNRKVYPSKLSVVTDEGEEEACTESAKQNGKCDTSASGESPKSRGQQSVFSQDSEKVENGKEFEIGSSFFQKEISKSHSDHDGSSNINHSPSSLQSSSRSGFSRSGNSINNEVKFAPDTNTSCEKATLNFSFFQKQRAGKETEGRITDGSEKELLNISFFKKQMGSESEASLLSPPASSERGVLSRGASNILELNYGECDVSKEGGGDKSTGQECGDENEDIRTIYKAGEDNLDLDL